MTLLFLQSLMAILFLTIIFLHLTKRNLSASIAFGVQSVMVAFFFLNSFLETPDSYLLLVIIFTIIVKVILAPLFFIRLIKKHALAFNVSTYLNVPLTIIIMASLTFLAHLEKFNPLTNIVPVHHQLLSLALASIFLSLFLIVNRKGALSQIIGVLSLENSIVTFIIFAGLEKSPGMQIGVIFNILIWIMISTIFVSLLYRHFGSLNVTDMKNLTD